MSHVLFRAYYLLGSTACMTDRPSVRDLEILMNGGPLISKFPRDQGSFNRVAPGTKGIQGVVFSSGPRETRHDSGPPILMDHM